VTAGGDTGGDCIVVMGSEGDGLRTNVLRECSGVISVPVSDDALVGGVDSLNVSVAAGILMASLCGVAPVARQPQTSSGHRLIQCYHSAT
jgi:tRNA G18 (ribose-2'-O)-methylase SpoU